MNNQIVPHDPVANALELLKKLPDEIAFEIAESYTSNVPILEARKRVAQLRRLGISLGWWQRMQRSPAATRHSREICFQLGGYCPRIILEKLVSVRGWGHFGVRAKAPALRVKPELGLASFTLPAVFDDHE